MTEILRFAQDDNFFLFSNLKMSFLEAGGRVDMAVHFHSTEPGAVLRSYEKLFELLFEVDGLTDLLAGVLLGSVFVAECVIEKKHRDADEELVSSTFRVAFSIHCIFLRRVHRSDHHRLNGRSLV